MDCYIWSSSNQWEGFTAPSGSFLHSVKVPGWGVWYYSQDLSTPVLLDETTGNWGTGFPTQWSNQRNISSSCVVQLCSQVVSRCVVKLFQVVSGCVMLCQVASSSCVKLCCQVVLPGCVKFLTL